MFVSMNKFLSAIMKKKEKEQAGAELGQAQLKLGLIELEFNFV